MKNKIEEAGYRYYDFLECNIENIIKKNINRVTSEEWRTLIQMLYPENMIASGLFQPILIFEIDENGKRVDPPLEAYNTVDDIKNGDCLLFRIINKIKENYNFEFDKSWYYYKDKTIEEAKKY